MNADHLIVKKLQGVHNSIIQRCTNPNNKDYKHYGGRGICVCAEWNKGAGSKKFIEWAINNEYRIGLTIDRIDNDGDYSPENCRWVDMKTQCSNRRTTKKITYNNETLSMCQWGKRLGISGDAIAYQLKKGIKGEDIIRCYLENGKSNPRKTRNITTGEIFESVRQASKKYNIHESSISSACKRHGKSCGCYWEYID